MRNLSFTTLTSAEMRQLLEYQRSCSEASRASRPKPAPPAGLTDEVQRFFRTVRATVGAVSLSDEYARTVGRPQVFAMWTRYGMPTLMVTISPDDLASPLLMHFAGQHTAGEVPSGQARRLTLADRPGAAALAFSQYRRAFVRHVIGWSEKDAVPVKGGGYSCARSLAPSRSRVAARCTSISSSGASGPLRCASDCWRAA